MIIGFVLQNLPALLFVVALVVAAARHRHGPVAERFLSWILLLAVIGLTKTAALEFATHGIRVNSVSPGTIQTEMFDRAFGEGETEVKRTMAAQNPVGRIGTPEEIASSAVLCSVHPVQRSPRAKTSL